MGAWPWGTGGALPVPASDDGPGGWVTRGLGVSYDTVSGGDVYAAEGVTRGAAPQTYDVTPGTGGSVMETGVVGPVCGPATAADADTRTSGTPPASWTPPHSQPCSDLPDPSTSLPYCSAINLNSSTIQIDSWPPYWRPCSQQAH